MSTRKERLENKRAEQALARQAKLQLKLKETPTPLPLSSASNAGDVKSETAVTPTADELKAIETEIASVNKEMQALRKFADAFVTQQTTGADNVRWDLRNGGHFAGHNSGELNSMYRRKFTSKIKNLQTQLEILRNKQDPSRRAKIEERKKQDKAKQAFWDAIARLGGARENDYRHHNETQRAAALTAALLKSNTDQYRSAARVEGLDDDEKNGEGESTTPAAGNNIVEETVTRKSVGWLLGDKVYVRCYHLRGNEYVACDCIRDGGHESSTTHQLSERALRLLRQKKLVLRDAMAQSQKMLSSLGIQENPFGFAGSMLRRECFGLQT